jgi:hypothetical protein
VRQDGKDGDGRGREQQSGYPYVLWLDGRVGNGAGGVLGPTLVRPLRAAHRLGKVGEQQRDAELTGPESDRCHLISAAQRIGRTQRRARRAVREPATAVRSCIWELSSLSPVDRGQDRGKGGSQRVARRAQQGSRSCQAPSDNPAVRLLVLFARGRSRKEGMLRGLNALTLLGEFRMGA